MTVAALRFLLAFIFGTALHLSGHSIMTPEYWYLALIFCVNGIFERQYGKED